MIPKALPQHPRPWYRLEIRFGEVISSMMQAGLRAYVGKVCMNRNSKDYYEHSLEQNLADTEAFVGHVRYTSDTCPAILLLPPL